MTMYRRLKVIEQACIEFGFWCDNLIEALGAATFNERFCTNE